MQDGAARGGGARRGGLPASNGWLGLLLLLALALAGPVGADSSGMRLYSTCSSCHGKQGEGNVGANAPALAGLDAPYLLRQLQHFRDGVRGAHPDDPIGAVMRASVRSLDDNALGQLVEAIGKMPVPKPAPPRPRRLEALTCSVTSSGFIVVSALRAAS